MKKKGMIGLLMVAAVVSFQAFPVYADSAAGHDGSVSARLGFSVKIAERISLKMQEVGGRGEIKVAALVGPNATVDLNGHGISTGGGIYQGTAVQDDVNNDVYTVASP